jgi:hypothetical protein
MVDAPPVEIQRLHNGWVVDPGDPVIHHTALSQDRGSSTSLLVRLGRSGFESRLLACVLDSILDHASVKGGDNWALSSRLSTAGLAVPPYCDLARARCNAKRGG